MDSLGDLPSTRIGKIALWFLVSLVIGVVFDRLGLKGVVWDAVKGAVTKGVEELASSKREEFVLPKREEVASGKRDVCGDAETHWKSAQALGSVGGFEDHVAKFPSCNFATLARASIEALRSPPVVPKANLKPDNSSKSIYPANPDDLWSGDRALQVRVQYAWWAHNHIIYNWASSSATEIDIESWLLIKGSFTKIFSRSIPYLAGREYFQWEVSHERVEHSTVVVCLSYLLNKRRVQAIHFYSNRSGPAGMGGELNKARDSISEVDGTGRLCNTLPRLAQQFLQ